MAVRTVCVAGHLENEYSEIGTWKQRTDVSQDDLLDTKLWLVSRKSVWSSSSWRPQICQTLRFVVCKTFEILSRFCFTKSPVMEYDCWWGQDVSRCGDLGKLINWKTILIFTTSSTIIICEATAQSKDTSPKKRWYWCRWGSCRRKFYNLVTW